MRKNACRMRLEDIICTRADAPYQAGCSGTWVKVKCSSREGFVVLGWTPPGGSRVGIGSLHVGYYDPQGRLHYAGGVGSGYDDEELTAFRKRLESMEAEPPQGLLVAGDPIDRAVRWVRPEIVIEVQFMLWELGQAEGPTGHTAGGAPNRATLPKWIRPGPSLGVSNP